MTTPVVGQVVILKTQASPLREVPLVVSLVIDEDTVSGDALIDTSADWPVSGIPATHPCQLYENVERGSGVGQWRWADLSENLTEYVGTAVADATAELVAVPAAGTSVSSPALATPRRPSTTRPTRIDVYGTIALPSALLAVQSATVELRADASATPTTAVGGPLTGESGIGNVGTQKIPFTLSYDLPAGHYYQVVQTAGGGTASLTRINETPL